ncbi:prohead peptidase [Pseudomonas amygdali pv. aesculi str. 0893_23]|uniref:HK97 family phage prohead protease n=1 Tax=Pseudomonas syringae group genomosp. 2 TaxID=251698 RepID=UPI0001CC410F|nr:MULTISPECIES: HK97 family phage prohead protease [Pseudomonas syringae group genomosp. 2]EGH00964.1 prohead peptidase [Pseudomonas amygdali pv. aesculi str. 0893_23]KPW08176.1 Prohead peptidase [Pseudomonas amygdali pv. aesculi]MCQ3009869.1 HK97 family phage prohead protease [Pseudomonas savastanoi]
MRPFYTAPLQIKLASDESVGTFTGYASTFDGEPDLHGDIVAPGAFAKSLAKHAAAGTRPALLWQHDQSNPIGAWNSFQEDAKGLLSSGRLTMEVPQAKAAHALAKDGALALSIGYTVPLNGAELINGARLLKEIDLVEVSLVGVAANPNSRIVSVKSFDSTAPNPREFERTVRDALGLSAREAKRFMAGGWNELVRDEPADDSEELARIAAKLQRITASLQGR